MFSKRAAVLASVVALGVGAFAGTAYSRPLGHDAGLRAKNLTVQVQDDASTVTSTSLTSFTQDFVTIPASGKYRVLVRFSGESDCNAVTWCSLQINVNGVQASPKSGIDFAFDSPGGNAWTSNSVERISDVISGTGSPRQVLVDVLTAAVSGGTWRLDDWTVVAQVFKV